MQKVARTWARKYEEGNMELGKTICKKCGNKAGNRAGKKNSRELGKMYIKVVSNLSRKYAIK